MMCFQTWKSANRNNRMWKTHNYHNTVFVSIFRFQIQNCFQKSKSFRKIWWLPENIVCMPLCTYELPFNWRQFEAELQESAKVKTVTTSLFLHLSIHNWLLWAICSSQVFLPIAGEVGLDVLFPFSPNLSMTFLHSDSKNCILKYKFCTEK